MSSKAMNKHTELTSPCTFFEYVLSSQAQYKKQQHYLNNVFPKMIAMVFLLIGANLLFICFSFQRKGNKHRKGNKLCSCLDIVWTHNPSAVSKTSNLNSVFAKMIEMMCLLIVPNPSKSSVYMFFFPKQWNRNG